MGRAPNRAPFLRWARNAGPTCKFLSIARPPTHATQESNPNGWSGLEFRHLEALAAIAAQGSFRLAAVELGYTQSAISQQIRRLERVVGERVIRRPARGRPLALTPAGESLIRLHGILAAAVTATRTDLDAWAGGAADAVRVATTFRLPQLCSALISLREDHPQTAFELGRVSEDEALTLLGARAVDVAVVRSVVEHEGGFAERFSSGYVCLAPTLSTLARKARVSLAELDGYPRISTADGTAYAADVRSPLLVADVEMLFELVAGGLGVGVVPAVLAPATRRVLRRPLAETFPRFEFSVRTCSDPTRPAIELFAKLAEMH